jgi:hypothetical protein
MFIQSIGTKPVKPPCLPGGETAGGTQCNPKQDTNMTVRSQWQWDVRQRAQTVADS